MKENNPTVEKSFSFAPRIVKMYRYLCEQKKEYILSKQVLRSGTCIGANVHEALHGQSAPDFAAMMNIALKGASETDFWLRLLYVEEYLPAKDFTSIYQDMLETLRLLISITKTLKAKTEEENQQKSKRPK